MKKTLLNICGPSGSGKTTFVLDWAQRASAGLQIITPARLGEHLRRTDMRFDHRLAGIFVIDEFHQWDILSLSRTLNWLFTEFGARSSIQVVVMSQDELDVLAVANYIGATVTTIRLAESDVSFDEKGFIVGVAFRAPAAASN